MIRVQRCICEIYSRVQLESVGFRFGKCAKDKKITLLTVDTLEELLNEVPRGIIIILPNQDLSSPDYTTTNGGNVDASYENSSIEQLGHNRYNRLVRRYSQTQLNLRQESSNNEFDDNYQDMHNYNMRRIIRRESVDTQSDSQLQRNNDESGENFQDVQDRLINRRGSYQSDQNLSKLLHYLANIN